jgi:hypothetical protein
MGETMTVEVISPFYTVLMIVAVLAALAYAVTRLRMR